MYIKSKKYLKNRLNEFVSVSDLDISDLKDNLLPIIKGVDTYCWSYIKKRERNSSRVVSISLNTDSEFQRLFDAVKQTNSVWKFYKYVPSPELEECFAYFDIQRPTDFKQLLEDPECRDIIENEANVKFIFNSDRKNDLHLLAKERRRFRREQEKVNDIYSYFNYTWDENEALAAVTNKKHVWVVRTNEYPNLPALFFYPKTPINSKDEEELISKYSHKLATAYKYELRDPSVNAYWLARPCRYPWFKEHPMPDGSELIIKINESKNKLTNMNTLNRDRNTLKRLVESYGKKDVLNFVRHLNESFDEYDFLDYDDCYEIFNGPDADLVEELFEKYNFDISIIDNIPELLSILKRRYPDFKIINNSHKWAVVLWNPEEGVLSPSWTDDEDYIDLVGLLPYDDEHTTIQEARRCWNMNKQAYIDTLP